MFYYLIFLDTRCRRRSNVRRSLCGQHTCSAEPPTHLQCKSLQHTCSARASNTPAVQEPPTHLQCKSLQHTCSARASTQTLQPEISGLHTILCLKSNTCVSNTSPPTTSPLQNATAVTAISSANLHKLQALLTHNTVLMPRDPNTLEGAVDYHA